MPLSSNGYASQTVATTQQVVACKPQVAGLQDVGILPEQFLLTVLDALERKGYGPALDGLDSCDAVEAFRNAACAVNNISPPFNIDPQKVMAFILLKLN